MPYTITARGLRKAYGAHVVLDGVDLAVETGSVFAMLGPNGAGKTTMVKILSTLVRPDGGDALVAGHDLRTDADGVRRSISLTGQYAAVDEVLTAAENLQMMARLQHLSPAAARARTRELLAEFDLTDVRDRRVKALSGGLRRRVDLAISMIARPQLIFLDEPTTGLDPRSREQVWATVRALVDAGTTILLTTQYLEEADRLADRIAMLHGGRIVAEGTAAELKSGVAGEVAVFEFADDAAFGRAQEALRTGAGEALDTGDATYRSEARTAEVRTDGSGAQIRMLLSHLDANGAPVHRMSLHRPSLDDVFLSLTTEPVQEAAR